MTAPAMLDRLGRRGKLTITVEDGTVNVRLHAPGPYRHGSAPTWLADLYQHCRLGAQSWVGEGTDLGELLTECDEASRPDHHDVDELRWKMECRTLTRTHGPPLPWYRRWHGWHPGAERWLSCYSHASEYVLRYLADLGSEREVEQVRVDGERARRQAVADRAARHRFAVKRYLG